MQEKKKQIHDDEFYGVKSPLQMPSAFSKNNKQKVIQKIPEQDINSSEKYENFYIHEKFSNNNAYKKLFAPKNLISHRSSMIDINIDYQIETGSIRKSLRITLSLTNIGSYPIKNISFELMEKRSKLIMVNPKKIFIK